MKAIGAFALAGGTSLALRFGHRVSVDLDFERKYRNADRFIVLRSLAWFEDAEQEPDPVSLAGLTWDQVKSKVSSLLRGIE